MKYDKGQLVFDPLSDEEYSKYLKNSKRFAVFLVFFLCILLPALFILPKIIKYESPLEDHSSVIDLIGYIFANILGVIAITYFFGLSTMKLYSKGIVLPLNYLSRFFLRKKPFIYFSDIKLITLMKDNKAINFRFELKNNKRKKFVQYIPDKEDFIRILKSLCEKNNVELAGYDLLMQ